jgi:hypothetical protein
VKHVSIRNVNLDGLGDRRGWAIEEVAGPRSYFVGTIRTYRPGHPRFAIYLDGVHVATRRTATDAESYCLTRERWAAA